MRIGIDASRALRFPRTGTENYSLYLIQALVALESEHEFVLYADRQPPPGLIGGERVSWRGIPFPRMWTHLRLAREVTVHPPDVLFVPAHVVPLVRRCPTVVTVHDLGYLYHGAAHRPLDRAYLCISTRWNARVARYVLADSKATRKDLVQELGCDPGRIVVAYPAGTRGMRPVTDRERLQHVKSRYGTGSLYWLYVGSIQPRKNLETLIEAFESLMQSGLLPAESKLVLAGPTGWYQERIRTAAAASAVAKQIVMPGYVESDDLSALMSGALAYILPSWYEGFGLPVLEAMACGTPVICSNVSSLPEVAGDAALLFDPGDAQALAAAMGRLWRDRALRRKLAELGQERAAGFSWERCAETVMPVLEKAAKGV